MKFIFILFFCLLFFSSSHAQNHDAVWPMGYQNVYIDPDGNVTPEELERLFRFYQFEFSEDGYKIIKTGDRVLPIHGTLSIYCDDKGKMLYYTNGQAICDSSHQKIEGGEKIGTNNQDYWDYNALNPEWPWGYFSPQGILFLPWPDKDSLITLSLLYNISEDKHDLFTYNIISTKEISKLVLHDKVIKKGHFKTGKITATRHGNGRDWWIC